MTWFRLYTEVRHDRKLRRLPPEHRWLWIVMLAIAKESPKPGWIMVSGKVPMTVEDIADEAAIEVESAKLGIEEFLRLEMIEEIDGALHVTNWEKRQFVSDNGTERWKKWKEGRKGKQPSNVGSTLDQRLNQQPANVEPTVPDYRVQSILIASKDYKNRMLSASPGEPGNAPQLPMLSAPDGAVHVQDALTEEESHSPEHEEDQFTRHSPSRETNCLDIEEESRSEEMQRVDERSAGEQPSAGHHPDAPVQIATDDGSMTGVTPAPQNALSSSKLPDEIAIERLSPCPPCSAIHSDDGDEKTPLIGHCRDISSCLTEPSPEPADPIVPDGKPGDESLPDTECRETESASSTDPKTEPEHYLTKRKRKLTGWKLETFDEFWKAFAYKKGRAEAADAWLDIPGLSPELAARIIEAARKEAKSRQDLILKGQTPKWAQGWLSGRRWEDWEENGTATHEHDSAAGQPDSDEDPYYSNYRRL